MIDAKKMSLDEMAKLAIKSEDEGVLDEIADSNCLYAMIFVARNKHTNQSTLKKMAETCKSKTLCEALLECPKLDEDAKKLLLAAS